MASKSPSPKQQRGGGIARERGGGIAQERGGGIAQERGGGIAQERGGGIAQERGGGIAEELGGGSGGGGGGGGGGGSGDPDPNGKLANIDNCIDDARDAQLQASTGPAEPTDYNQLLGRLEAAKASLPPMYRVHFVEPFVAELRRLGAPAFGQLLAGDPGRERGAGLMLDLAQAILQNGEGFESLATDAFAEVVSDLYDGFLSAEDRSGLKLPDYLALAPLIKWGNPDFGPYTWPIDSTASFNVEAAVVSLPPGNASAGLFAWTALGHETAGHDVLHADEGLEQEFSQRVFDELHAKVGAELAEYWSTRIDETASDVMGILNMGPAAAIGLIIYFRGLNEAFAGERVLRHEDPGDDPHPVDILRGFLAASTVRQLKFSGAAAWAETIEKETEKDLRQIVLGSRIVALDKARQSCEIVARTLTGTRMTALNNHSLLEIQNWTNGDESIVAELRDALITNAPISADRTNGTFAAHVVSAAALVAASGASSVRNVFQRMLAVLNKMHDANAAWGPLFVAHPGMISRDLAYTRHPKR